MMEKDEITEGRDNLHFRIKMICAFGIFVLLILATVLSASATLIILTNSTLDTDIWGSGNNTGKDNLFRDNSGNIIIAGQGASTCASATISPTNWAVSFSRYEGTNISCDSFGIGFSQGRTTTSNEFYGFQISPGDRNKSRFSSTNWNNVDNEFACDDSVCPMADTSCGAGNFHSSLDITEDFFFAVRSGVALKTCQLSPKVLLGNPITTTIPDIKGVTTIDTSLNRIALFNNTHFQIHDFDTSNNLSLTKECEGKLSDLKSNISGLGIAGGYTYYGSNGWLYFSYDDGTMQVINGESCNLQEEVMLPGGFTCYPDLGGPSFGGVYRNFVVDTEGIHCVDGTTPGRYLKFTADWQYPVVSPAGAVEPTCTSPCIFNDTFSYIGTTCIHGWTSSPVSCGRALANNTHLSCDADIWTLSRSFPSVDEGSGFIFLTFDYRHNDDTTTFIVLQDSSLGLPVTRLMFDGFDEKIRGNTGAIDLGNLPLNISQSYTLRFDFSSNTWRFSRNGTVIESSIPFENEVDSMDFLHIQSDLLFDDCDFDFDFIKLAGVVAAPGSPGGPGGPDTINQSAGVHWGGALVLNPRNASFDTSFCKTNEDANFCFLRIGFSNIGAGIASFVFGNIAILIIIFMIIVVIVSTRS